MLIWIAFIVFAIFALAGFFLSFAGISGPLFVITGAVLFNLITWSAAISWWVIGVLLLLTIIGELFEAVLFFRAGLSQEGWKGLFSGAIIGSRFKGSGKFLGVILGSLAGAFIGEFSSNSAGVAWNKTKSLFKRKIVSSAVKIFIVLVQIWLVIQQLI